MRLLISAAVALTLVAGAVWPTRGLAAPKPANPVVKVTFADAAAHNIKSDGGGVYQDGTGGVRAYIDRSNGALYFYSQLNTKTPGRDLYFSFAQCLANCLPSTFVPPVSAPYPSGYAVASIFAGVRTASADTVSGGLLGMPTGVEMRSGIHLNIPLVDDPAWWTMCMKAGPVDGFCANSQQSTAARVIRSPLGVWTISAAPGDVAELMNDRGNMGRTRLIDYLGTYSMPFSFTVECVNAAECPIPEP